MPELRDYYLTRANLCPRCGYTLTGAMVSDPKDPEGRAPQPGDTCVCISCASVLVLKDDLALRPATAEELVEIFADHELGPVLRRAILSVNHAQQVLGPPSDTPRGRKN